MKRFIASVSDAKAQAFRAWCEERGVSPYSVLVKHINDLISGNQVATDTMVPMAPDDQVLQSSDWHARTEEERAAALTELEGKRFDNLDDAYAAYRRATDDDPDDELVSEPQPAPEPSTDEADVAIALMASEDIAQKTGWDLDKAGRLVAKLGVDRAVAWVREHTAG